MRIKMKMTITVTFLICLTGCLSFGVEDQNNIAATGAIYSSQTSAIVDEAIQSMNSSDSAALLVTKIPDSLKSDPRFSEEELTKRLNISNEGLISNTVSALELKASLNSVNAYFYGLQALVDDPTADRNVLAVANLANQVNNLNDALQEKGRSEPAISREKGNAVLQLTRVVSDQIHARKVKKALLRDAPVIAMALYLQSEVLSFSEMTIFRDLTSMTNRFYVDKVEQPYQKQDSTMNVQWVANRTLYLKTMANIKELEARQTNRDDAMLQINLWSSALSGKYDPSIVSEQIIDIRKMISLKTDIEKALEE